MATTINAGRVAMVPKGEWSASTAYVRLDVVSYHGSSYVCKQDCTGQNPSTATGYWQLLSSGLDPTVDTISAKHYEGSTMTAETSISAAGVISKTASGVTKTFNLPAESGTLATASQVAAKQDALVSGTNIKTINGTSMLGSGNIDTSEVLVVIMTKTANLAYTADKTIEQIANACDDGKTVVALMVDDDEGASVLPLAQLYLDADVVQFSTTQANTVVTLQWAGDGNAFNRVDHVLQPRLVSGTNIKTVNSTSLLGSGNVDIVGKSAYQSYVDTTTDSPVKTEAEWVASLKGADGVDLGGVAIADNLTTDDATKVLSARQGYLLGQEVAEIYPSFFGNVDISAFEEMTLFPNGANWLVNNNYKCKFLKCLPGSTYYVTANATNNSHITFVKSIGTSGQAVDYATGYNNVVAITSGQTKSFVAPSDAVYMCIAVLEVSDRTPTAIVQQTLKDEIDKSMNTKADLVKQVGKNLFDKTKIVAGYYIFYSNGSLATDSDSSVSGLIPIEPGEVYHIHRPGIAGTGAVRFLAADNTVLIPQKVDGTAWSNYEPTNGDTGNTYQECKVKAPATAVYIQFTTQFNGNGNLDAMQIEKGLDFTNYEPYTETMVLSPSQLPAQAVKKWTGKKWVAVGDSLTEVNAKTTKNYHAYISEETGISVVNMGLSGSGYHTLYDTNRAFYQRVASIPTDADVITIFGSGNDLTFAASNLGSPEDTTTDTICGCVNTTLDTILSVYMASGKVPVIGVITPTPWSGNTPDNPTCTMALYSNAIIECCKRKSIPVLDLYHGSNLHPGNATFRTLAYSRDGGGGVHPDERGHEIIAPMIEKFLGGLINS